MSVFVWIVASMSTVLLLTVSWINGASYALRFAGRSVLRRADTLGIPRIYHLGNDYTCAQTMNTFIALLCCSGLWFSFGPGTAISAYLAYFLFSAIAGEFFFMVDRNHYFGLVLVFLERAYQYNAARQSSSETMQTLDSLIDVAHKMMQDLAP